MVDIAYFCPEPDSAVLVHFSLSHALRAEPRMRVYDNISDALKAARDHEFDLIISGLGLYPGQDLVRIQDPTMQRYLEMHGQGRTPRTSLSLHALDMVRTASNSRNRETPQVVAYSITPPANSLEAYVRDKDFANLDALPEDRNPSTRANHERLETVCLAQGIDLCFDLAQLVDYGPKIAEILSRRK